MASAYELDSVLTRSCNVSCSLRARPSVSCRMPSLVQRRYEGMGWYVSGRIYNVSFSPVRKYTGSSDAHLAFFHANRRDDIVGVADPSQSRDVAHI